MAEVARRAKAFAAKWRKLCPAAVECLEADFEHLTTYLRFPAGHHSRIRHSNFIERTFGKTRRRVKVIGRLPGERSCLSLVWEDGEASSRRSPPSASSPRFAIAAHWGCGWRPDSVESPEDLSVGLALLPAPRPRRNPDLHGAERRAR